MDRRCENFFGKHVKPTDLWSLRAIALTPYFPRAAAFCKKKRGLFGTEKVPQEVFLESNLENLVPELPAHMKLMNAIQLAEKCSSGDALMRRLVSGAPCGYDDGGEEIELPPADRRFEMGDIKKRVDKGGCGAPIKSHLEETETAAHTIPGPVVLLNLCASLQPNPLGKILSDLSKRAAKFVAAFAVWCYIYLVVLSIRVCLLVSAMPGVN